LLYFLSGFNLIPPKGKIKLGVVAYTTIPATKEVEIRRISVLGQWWGEGRERCGGES
jgi:hypothetical protein